MKDKVMQQCDHWKDTTGRIYWVKSSTPTMVRLFDECAVEFYKSKYEPKIIKGDDIFVTVTIRGELTVLKWCQPSEEDTYKEITNHLDRLFELSNELPLKYKKQFDEKYIPLMQEWPKLHKQIKAEKS